ncbi:MAG: S16 family serine protease [Actinomycetota bacterium]
MSRRAMTLAVSAGLLVLLLAGAAVMPVPYIALAPGPLYDTIGRTGGKPIIDVVGHPAYHPAGGHLYLTTVSVIGAPGYTRMTLFEAMRYWADRSVAVVPREVEYPPGRDTKAVEAETKQQMVESQDAAKIAALRFLGEKVTTEGLVVGDIEPGKPAEGKLKPGDALKTIDGVAITSASDLREKIRARPVGSAIKVGYARAGQEAAVEIVTVASPDGSGKSVIGVTTHEMCPCKTPFEVKIALGEDVGGPSAGLMFTLGILDTLTPGEMTRGMTIAGTGTMDVDGKVGPIGGIKQKLIAAKRKGAVAFLVPDANWDEANQAPPRGLELHRVSDLPGAVHELCSISKATESPCGT